MPTGIVSGILYVASQIKFDEKTPQPPLPAHRILFKCAKLPG